MSVAKGLNKALDHALSINADTMQIFTRNPRVFLCECLLKELIYEQ